MQLDVDLSKQQYILLFAYMTFRLEGRIQAVFEICIIVQYFLSIVGLWIKPRELEYSYTTQVWY